MKGKKKMRVTLRFVVELYRLVPEVQACYHVLPNLILERIDDLWEGMVRINFAKHKNGYLLLSSMNAAFGYFVQS